MAKKWLNTGCSYLIYTFHLGMFRKSFATPTRKDIGAGGTVWTDIATHVFNYTKHLFKSSVIKRIWLQHTFNPVFLQNVNSLLTSPTATAWWRRIKLVFGPLDFRNWWKQNHNREIGLYKKKDFCDLFFLVRRTNENQPVEWSQGQLPPLEHPLVLPWLWCARH